MKTLRQTVDALLSDYHDDHNWAIQAAYRLRLAIHVEDDHPIFRKDCPICVATAHFDRILESQS
jgi:hypothetical protein